MNPNTLTMNTNNIQVYSHQKQAHIPQHIQPPQHINQLLSSVPPPTTTTKKYSSNHTLTHIQQSIDSHIIVINHHLDTLHTHIHQIHNHLIDSKEIYGILDVQRYRD